jgi:hypothetical protein
VSVDGGAVADEGSDDDGGDGDGGVTAREAELRARLETLEDENRQLRRELNAARRTSYRRTAFGMAVLGALALAGAAVLPPYRDVLFALGGTGLFGALLTYYLTPERFVAASVGETVYAAAATNLEVLAAELELSDAAVYVPVDGDPAVRLYLPEQPPAVVGVPNADDLRDAFVVVGDHRGLALCPTGDDLRAEFVEAASPLPDGTAALVRAAGEALVEQFELVDAADPDVDVAGGRATVRVTGSAYGPVDRLDHPVASLLATTLARHLDRPVELETEPADDADAYLVTCRWEPGDGD